MGSIQLFWNEFNVRPDIYVVWARPEESRRWLLQEYENNGWITGVIDRFALPDEDHRSTTFSESHNINLGLDFLRKRYKNHDNTYVIVQSADCGTLRGTYVFIDETMLGHDGIVFRWHNAISHVAWHTNFFVIKLNQMGPPLCKEDPDVLEVVWTRTGDFSKFYQTHNSKNRFFLHQHLDPNETWFPEIPQKNKSGVYLFTRGKMSWLKLLLNLIRKANWLLQH